MTPPGSTEPFIKEQLLDAPVHSVWSALTEKEQLKGWCFDIPSFVPVVGCDFTFWGEKDGVRFLHLCRVLEVAPLKKMKWRWTYEGIVGETFVTFELITKGNKTNLKLTHEGLHHLPQDENYARQNFEAGWNTIIGDLLPAYLAQKY